MTANKEDTAITYEGGCLCKETSYVARGEPSNPHLCSCTMCQKSSGAPTVAWVEFSLVTFEWVGESSPSLHQSSEKTQRCFCAKCGCFLGAIDEGYENISITMATLKNPDQIELNQKHSFKESAPSWWEVN